MSPSLTTLTAGLLLGTTLTCATAAPKEPWYSLRRGPGQAEAQCAPPLGKSSPEDYIRMLERQGRPYHMDDIVVDGVVVQTTLRGLTDVDGWPLTSTWYRGQARCEAAKKAAQQRAHEHEATIQRKYR